MIRESVSYKDNWPFLNDPNSISIVIDIYIISSVMRASLVTSINHLMVKSQHCYLINLIGVRKQGKIAMILELTKYINDN